MGSNSIKCSCFTTINVRKMALKLFVLLNVLCLLQRTFAVPDYKTLHQKLSMREEDEKARRKGHNGSPLIAEIGKVFKFSLNDYTLKSRGNSTATVSICLLPIMRSGLAVRWGALHIFLVWGMGACRREGYRFSQFLCKERH